jgi:UDP-2,3-diacylglucosamine pyrophosphatase LpxH
MKKLSLAVISDIHVGDRARARDLCPDNAPGRDAKLDEKYKERFLQFLKTSALRADYLVLPGDVTSGAQPDEVKIASEFIAAAAVALGVRMANVLFVPGNHDVDWEVLKLPDSTGVRHRQRFDPIRHKDFHFKAIVERGSGSLFDAPHFTVWNYSDLLVVGYNSAHHDKPTKELHHGLIDRAHVEEMRRVLPRFTPSEDQLRLFLVHHHPLQYSEPTPDPPDVSIMVNAEQLQALLREFKFDILVHGHKHLPHFCTYSLDGSPEVAILCSGSFSVQIDTRWTGTINNQFHLITIDGRDPEEHLILGRVNSWSYYYTRGWVPSEAVHDGIPHVEPFGTYIRATKLESVLRPILEDGFKIHDFVEWSWVLDQAPALAHVRPEQIISALDRLAGEGNFRRLHDTPEKLILLRNK